MAEKLKPSSLVEFNGETLSLNAWAGRLGCTVQALLGRFQRGWSTEKALTSKAGAIGGQNRGQKAPAEVLTPDELQRLLDKCSGGATGQRNRAMIVVGWRAGLRISEVLALTPANLDPAEYTIRVLHGKGDKPRTTGLDRQAWAVVATWLEARAAAGIGPEQTLFCTLKGGRLDDRYVRELMPRLATAAGIAKRVHFHGLRHTMAFELANEGLPIHLIQQQLGHSSAAVTAKYLAHLNPAETIAAMKARTWGKQPTAIAAASGVPSPGWLDRLREEIGGRLMLFHDGRSSETEFKAAVLLF